VALVALRLGEPRPGQRARDLGPDIVAALGHLGQPVQERLEDVVLLRSQQRFTGQG